MIQLFGAVFIIGAAYILGVSIQKKMVTGEKVVGELEVFFSDLRTAIGYNCASIPTQIVRCADKEYLENLTFLNGLTESSFRDQTLSEVLDERFARWEFAPSISKDERSLVRTVFAQLGRRNVDSEIAQLDYARDQMKQFREKRRVMNEKRKGFYEAVFTLAGIAVAILLL